MNASFWMASLALCSGLFVSHSSPQLDSPAPVSSQNGSPLIHQAALNSGEYIPAQGDAPIEIQASFIVKFNDQTEVTSLARNFRKDRLGTQMKFAQWAQQHPPLQGLILSSASYSGELILSLPVNDSLGRAPEDVLAAIREIESCAYAEMDTMAYPSGGDR